MFDCPARMKMSLLEGGTSAADAWRGVAEAARQRRRAWRGNISGSSVCQAWLRRQRSAEQAFEYAKNKEKACCEVGRCRPSHAFEFDRSQTFSVGSTQGKDILYMESGPELGFLKT
jgi:hypothetical protein